MKRQIKTIVVTAASIAMTLVNNIPAQAGGHGGGGFRSSVGRSHISSHFSHHAATRHHHHTYRRPVCAQRPIVQLQPVQLQPVQPRPVQLQPVQPRPVQPQLVQPQLVQPQLVQPQLGQPRSVQSQSVQQPISSQPLVRSSQGITSGQQRSAPAIQNRTVQIPATSQPAPASDSNTGNSEASALAMLASISNSETPTTQPSAQIPEFTAASSQTAGSHVGNWSVRLPSNQSITLTLNEDSSFVWMATKDGKSSSFQGQFRLEEGRLTLVRSNDLQQMQGSWTGESDKFTFKLDGATTSGLAFARS